MCGRKSHFLKLTSIKNAVIVRLSTSRFNDHILYEPSSSSSSNCLLTVDVIQAINLKSNVLIFDNNQQVHGGAKLIETNEEDRVNEK